MRKGNNMKAKEFLEEQKLLIDGFIKDTEKKYDRMDLVALMGSVFLGTLGIFNVFSLPLYGASLLGTAASLYISKILLNKRKEKELARFKKEKSHIEKIESKGLNVSPEVTKKRIDKINSLIVENNKKTKKYKNWKRANNIALIGLGASVVVGTLIPIVGAVATAVTAASKLFTSSKLTKSHEELEFNKNRVNNLITDVNAIKLSKKSTRQRPRRVAQQPKQTKQVRKQRVNARQQQNAQSVQAYVDRLANVKSVNRPKQKAKY